MEKNNERAANLAVIGTGILSFAIITFPYMRTRLINWYYNPNPDPTSQVERAKQALHNGGFLGNGFGDSVIKEGFMAEVHTDFILPIIDKRIVGIISELKAWFGTTSRFFQILIQHLERITQYIGTL